MGNGTLPNDLKLPRPSSTLPLRPVAAMQRNVRSWMNSGSGLAALEGPLAPPMLVDGCRFTDRNASPRPAHRSVDAVAMSRMKALRAK